MKIAVALTVGAALMGGTLAVASSTGSTQSGHQPEMSAHKGAARSAPPRLGDHLPVKDAGEPCDEAKHASSVAGLATSIPVWAPEGERLTDAWTCGGVPELLYGNVEIWFEDGYKNVDPKVKLPRMVASDDGHIQTINGRLAYVHPADARGPRNGVWILAGDYSVGLIAKPEVGIDRVLALAHKIHIPASVG